MLKQAQCPNAMRNTLPGRKAYSVYIVYFQHWICNRADVEYYLTLLGV